MKRTFSRQELYDLVWSTPIAILAGQFEISDRGLAKTCATHQIPVPGRGYWAKVEAGQPANKTPLWQIENPGLDPVHIGGAKSSANPYVAFAIAAAQSAVRQSNDQRETHSVSKPISSSPPIEKSIESRDAVALEPVRRPHASVSTLATELRSAKPDRIGEIAFAGIKIHHSSRSRAIAILHHVALGLEQKGITISVSDGAIRASIARDNVRLEISETRKREKHIPTQSELKKNQDFERRREIARRRGEWLYPENFWPEFDYIYSGNLTFEIQNWADGARKRWSDGKRQTLESMLDGITDGVLFHIAFEKARREEREEQEQRRLHMAHRLDLHKKRLEREAKREEFLRKLAADQREATDLRVTIANSEAVLDHAAPEYVRMIGWTKDRLAILEAQNRIDVLTSNLMEQELFPEPDELFDPEGDPPPLRNYWDG